jgi:YegS/Rv2252/BmrU family lipid kinase
VNPDSGRGKGDALGEEVVRLLTEDGIEVTTIRVGADHAGPADVRGAIHDGVDLVVIIGGDGTLRASLETLVRTQVLVLLVPGGTSNLVATHLGMPAKPQALVKVLTTGEERKLDVARLDGEAFVLAAGFGLATDVIEDANQELKRFLGPIAYLWSFFTNFTRKRVRTTFVFEDGRRVKHNAKIVLITNCAETLASVDVVPGSSVQDGLLDVAVFRFATFWQFLRLCRSAITGRWQRTREAVFYRTTSLEVWLDRPMPIQIDGDVFEERDYFQVKLEPAALRVIAPKPKSPGVPKEWLQDLDRQLEKLRTGSRQDPEEILRGFWDDYLERSSGARKKLKRTAEAVFGERSPRDPDS